jgi:outer membrane protein assembly factor BamE (lipoprotein component of BamABCDE complex)
MAICRGIVLAVLVLALTAAAGCLTTSGNQNLIRPDLMDQIQESVTTKADVRRLLGDPGLIQGSSYTETWFYHYKGSQIKPLAMIPILGKHTQQGEVKEVSLSLTFDGRGILQRKDWKFQNEPFPRQSRSGDHGYIPWAPRT